MNMLKIILSSIVVVVLCAGYVDVAQAETYPEKLNRLYLSVDDDALYAALLKTENKSDFVHALDFLKGKIVDQRIADSDYHAIYAMLLWRAGIKDTAAGMAAATLLILYADKARCADESAGYTKLTSRFTLFKEMLEYLRNADEDEKKVILDIAMTMEERLSGRDPNRSLCYTGAATTSAALDYAKKNNMDLEKTGRNSYVIPDFDHIDVEYVDADEWNRRREEIRTEFPNYFVSP